MIELDLTPFPGPVVTALMLRGAQVPPLQWHVNPQKTAKSTLDGIADDRQLLKREVLASPEMAGLVRGLLYFWNGWPAEAAMYAQLAPQRELAYLRAFVARQSGDSATAKQDLQTIEVHPIHHALATYARNVIGKTPQAQLKRLREVIEFAEQWEPFLYSDVFELAREGKLQDVPLEVVRKIQCREFELLFAFCYEVATGLKITGPKKSAEPPRPQPKAKPKPKPAEEPTHEEKLERFAKARAVLKPIDTTGQVGVLCPKCKAMVMVPENRRGSQTRCQKCAATFLVPARTQGAQPRNS